MSRGVFSPCGSSPSLFPDEVEGKTRDKVIGGHATPFDEFGVFGKGQMLHVETCETMTPTGVVVRSVFLKRRLVDDQLVRGVADEFGEMLGVLSKLLQLVGTEPFGFPVGSIPAIRVKVF